MKVSDSAMVSSISRPAMLRLEKRRQQAIDLQQARARQFDVAVRDRQEAVVLQPPPAVGERADDILAELRAEVVGLQASRLELQHHLAPQQLVRLDLERPAQRQLP